MSTNEKIALFTIDADGNPQHKLVESEFIGALRKPLLSTIRRAIKANEVVYVDVRGADFKTIETYAFAAADLDVTNLPWHKEEDE